MTDNKSDMVFEPSNIENVDLAMYSWIDQKLDLYANTNKGWKKTPVIWITGERSWQVKHKKELRDSNNNFILPVITLERTEMVKDKEKKGKYWGDVRPNSDEKGGSIAIHTVINQKKTSNYANSSSKRVTGQPNFKRENNKIVYETKFIPMPVYITMNYIVTIKTEYQQQMNTLIQPFMTTLGGTNYFLIENEGHRYEAFMDSSFTAKNNISDLQQNERLFESEINIKVLAHLVGDELNNNRPKIITRESIVEVKIPREYVILGEEKEKIKLW